MVQLLIMITDQCIQFADASNRLVFCLSKMSVEKYKEVTTKMMAWHKLALVNQFIEKVLDLLKDGALVPKFDISQFVQAVKAIQDLQVAVEAKFVER